MSRFRSFSLGLILMPFLFFGCSQKGNKATIIKSPAKQSIEPKKKDIVQDTITIVFDSGIQLKWDVVKKQIVKDSYYKEILKSKKKLEIIANKISNTEDLKINVCSKKTADLKKGDVAFIYLHENRKIYLFSCLKMQFDVMNENCKYPDELLDYIDKNRTKVQKQVLDCMK